MEGYNTSKELEAKLKSTTADGISKKINDTINTLGLEGLEDEIMIISNHGKYFQFLQSFSNTTYAARPWSTTLQSVTTFFPHQTLQIQKHIDDAMEKIASLINDNVNRVMGKMKEH